MTPLNAIVRKDLLVNIVRKVDCQLYSIKFVSFQLFHCGQLHTIATNVEIAPKLIERLHPTTSVDMIASFAAEYTTLQKILSERT